jgi:hypothetical protein
LKIAEKRFAADWKGVLENIIDAVLLSINVAGVAVSFSNMARGIGDIVHRTYKRYNEIRNNGSGMVSAIGELLGSFEIIYQTANILNTAGATGKISESLMPENAELTDENVVSEEIIILRRVFEPTETFIGPSRK